MAENNTPTWDEVKRLFSGADISYMKMIGFPLDDYKFVSDNARGLLGRLTSSTQARMPPAPFEPWSAEKIKIFTDWMDAGFPEKATPDQKLQTFIQLSEFLTGFDDLGQDPELAGWYLNRLTTRPVLDRKQANLGGVDQTAFQKLMNDFDPADTAAFESQTLTDAACEKAARTVILLWYTSSFIDLKSGFPAGDQATGTPVDNRYISGLMWRAFHAHPMGYSTEGWFDRQTGKYSPEGEPYWSTKPERNGQFTGLGPNSVTP